MSKIIDISTYAPLKSDNFFFDANIWMYLYCPLGSYGKDKPAKYSGFLKKVLEVKSSIFISSLVLSEVFNAWIKLDYNILKDKDKSKYADFKKNYRNTELYRNQTSIIKTVVTKHILNIAKRTDDKFKSISLDELFKEIGVSDFNDNYYLTMANCENFKIVTNDYDFASLKEESVPILTANNKMLKRV